ncbi:peroxiredoxin-like family protein [Singulisphaera sp. GP187]|uniref:peroxiredoxin-like family protein n=1 Tax=Singulisphaera sp. GP187 TaxID=1882752 RepID=UPI0013564DA6|nr:peroxiredoxin-like family protein [Singulisphaera sp. GP187]
MDALNRSLTELVQAGVEKDSLQVGQRFPTFSLPNQNGQMVQSDDRLGPLVVTFYRSGWCPYCNLALRGMQRVLPELERLGGRLVAITPEQPDDARSTAEKDELTFDVLTERGFTLRQATRHRLEDSRLCPGVAQQVFRPRFRAAQRRRQQG